MNSIASTSTADELALTTKGAWFLLWTLIASPIFKTVVKTVPVSFDLYNALWQLQRTPNASSGALEHATQLQELLRTTRTRLVALYELVKNTEQDATGIAVDLDNLHLDVSWAENLAALTKSLRKRTRQLCSTYLGQDNRELELRSRDLEAGVFVFLSNTVHEAEENVKKGIRTTHFVRYRGQDPTVTEAEVFEAARILHDSDFHVSSDAFARHKSFFIDFLNYLLDKPIDELTFKVSGRSDAPSTTSSDSTSTSRAKYDGSRPRTHTPSSSVDSTSSGRVRFEDLAPEGRGHRNSSSGDPRPQIRIITPPYTTHDAHIQPPSRASRHQQQAHRVSTEPTHSRPRSHTRTEQQASTLQSASHQVEYMRPRPPQGSDAQPPQVVYTSGYNDYTVPVGGAGAVPPGGLQRRGGTEEDRGRRERGARVEGARGERRERRLSQHRDR